MLSIQKEYNDNSCQESNNMHTLLKREVKDNNEIDDRFSFI